MVISYFVFLQNEKKGAISIFSSNLRLVKIE